MNKNILIPGAIVVAGALIAGGVFLNNGGVPGHTVEAASAQRNNNAHVFGNPDAPIAIVEFSDFECPFCGRLHPTIERVVTESDGNIKWEYRHFPLPNHRNAESAAIASECVAELAGNDAFWDFSDVLFQNQRSLGMPLYESEATKHGVDLDAFRVCIEDTDTQDIVRSDYQAAVATGGRGTPHSVIIREDGTQVPFSGALPYEQLIGLINNQ